MLENRAPLQRLTPVTDHGRLNDTIVTFPIYKAASLLFQNYESNVDHMCRILHIPTVRSQMKTSYLRLSQNESLEPGRAALLLSIFALSAFFYPPSENSDIATNEQESVSLSKALSICALDVLDYSRRNTSGTLEDIQAYILMAYITFHLDGFSARGRLLSSTAVAMVRELRLHCLDSSRNLAAEKNVKVRDMIDREVKRRVFWCIAMKDWYVAQQIDTIGANLLVGFRRPSPVHRKACTSFTHDN